MMWTQRVPRRWPQRVLHAGYATSRAQQAGRSQRAASKQGIPGVDRIVLVSSAKGGVGKSTTAVNVAAALSQQGQRVGILDADVFGPSLPKLLNLKQKPIVDEESGKILPLENYGMQAMSIGFLVPADKAVVWRGPMVMSAVQQMTQQVKWGPLDILVIDMPPGTGDTQLSISQSLAVDGAIIVSTPQDLALIDAVRGVELFKQVRIPILGLVENMSYHTCTNCGHHDHVFGHGGAVSRALELGIDVLGQIPLDAAVCATSDAGRPIVLSQPDSAQAAAFTLVAADVLKQLASGPGTPAPTMEMA